MIHRLGRFFLTSLCFLFCSVLFVHPIMAGNYGDGNYGAGNYNEGQTPTPTAAPTPVATSTTSSSGSQSSTAAPPAPPGCGNGVPSGAPDLFQIDSTTTTSVRLYFSPVASNRDRYFVSFGTDASAQGNGFELMSNSTGVIAADVHALTPKTTYYFKVRAGNGCMPGSWSNTMTIVAGQRRTSYRWAALPKIIKTAITKKLKPQTVEIAQPVVTPAPSVAPSVIATAAPVQNRLVEPTSLPVTPSSQPGLFERLGNFFKGILGK